MTFVPLVSASVWTCCPSRVRAMTVASTPDKLCSSPENSRVSSFGASSMVAPAFGDEPISWSCAEAALIEVNRASNDSANTAISRVAVFTVLMRFLPSPKWALRFFDLCGKNEVRRTSAFGQPAQLRQLELEAQWVVGRDATRLGGQNADQVQDPSDPGQGQAAAEQFQQPFAAGEHRNADQCCQHMGVKHRFRVHVGVLGGDVLPQLHAAACVLRMLHYGQVATRVAHDRQAQMVE